MRDNMTLGEMKTHCEKLTAEHGESSCNHCEFDACGCCNTPESWKLEAGCAQPNWEEMYKASEESCRQMYMKMEDAHRRADRADEEIRRLRLVVSTVETMIGRKFDV